MKLKIYLSLLFVIGLINFLPLIGLLSTAQLSQAYGVVINNNELEVLMRHRALLFGIMGGFVFCALFKPQLRTAALVMTGISMVGFLFLVWSVGEVNDALMKVTMVDILGILCLLLAVVLHFLIDKDDV
ncbi:phosphopantetheine adenylyltransferase [Marinicella litoralis]|uniref:Phosphopantetheine adenylyltransferase n=1 Tax=Marinicella litoralis TaxID=644220 RepID=A0A4R6Y3D8_9GAMM|nr:phosphopantetheine adenylyltransferase [Marinicella litoralis]TDR23568.1 hypothetical protein C8D91_0431 [Marinicella litoralis]